MGEGGEMRKGRGGEVKRGREGGREPGGGKQGREKERENKVIKSH